MRKLLAAAVLAAAVAGVMPGSNLALGQAAGGQAAPAPAAKAGQVDVPVKVVVLFSSGVGYFEHLGTVNGNATTELQFKTQQINDILKSLILQDTKGTVGSIIYPSQDPIAKILKSFQVDITNNPSLADLLNQLRGAKVQVTAGTENLAGTILGLEKKQQAVKDGVIEVWMLNLISGATIRSVRLDEVSKLELEDAALQEELGRALAALAQARDQDKKPVTIHFRGEGERVVRLGYVVETPVWKTSYRLLLDAKDPKQAAIQGWAIVENQTDNDWNDVQMSLVSGRPISFIQELYRPLYVPRPVVQPELYASLRPQTYDAGLEGVLRRDAKADAGEAQDFGLADESTAGRRKSGMARAPMGAMAETAGAASRAGGRGLYEEALQAALDPTASVSSVASAAKAGELFQYTIGSVTLPRQKSAMLPIVADKVEIEKLSIYNQNVLARHPLNGVKMKNTSGKHLLHGPVTVTEANTYAGDARIDNVPPAQERLLSYGIDLQMLVNASKNTQQSMVQGGKIVKGVLHLTRKEVFSQDYAYESKADADKTLIIEHPFRKGWKLVQPEKAVETTETLYRFRTPAPAGKQGSTTVREELVHVETIAVLPMDFGTLDFYSRSGEIPQAVREALAKAVQLKQAVTDAERQLQRIKQESTQVAQEQGRVRENIKALPEKSPLQTRQIEKLQQQEDRLDALDKQRVEAQQALEARRKELEDYVSNLNVG